jgi:hypothetical protein
MSRTGVVDLTPVLAIPDSLRLGKNVSSEGTAERLEALCGRGALRFYSRFLCPLRLSPKTSRGLPFKSSTPKPANESTRAPYLAGEAHRRQIATRTVPRTGQSMTMALGRSRPTLPATPAQIAPQQQRRRHPRKRGLNQSLRNTFTQSFLMVDR